MKLEYVLSYVVLQLLKLNYFALEYCFTIIDNSLLCKKDKVHVVC